MMSDRWMYRAFGQEFGPLAFDELQTLAVSGTVSPSCEVRRLESSSWIAASTVEGLEFELSADFASSLKSSDFDLSTKAADDWYYNVGGLILGPVTFDELLELARSEQLAADDDIKLGSNGKWRRAGSVGRLVAVLPFEVAKAKRPAGPKPPAPAKIAQPTVPSIETEPAPVASPEPAQLEYHAAYEMAKGKIAALILTQAETAFQAAEAQANNEIAWALAPHVDRNWWGWMGTVAYGPVELPQVLALARNGQIKPTDFVRNGMLGQYVPLASVPGLYNAIAILTKAQEALELAKTQAKAAADLAVPAPPPSIVAERQKRQTPAKEIAVVREPEPASAPARPATPEQPAPRKRSTPAAEIPQRDLPKPESQPTVPKTAPAQPSIPAVDTDDEILARVRQALEARNIPAFNRLELELHQGELILRGNLTTEGERLLAIRAAQVSGVVIVVDSLTVAQSSRPTPIKSSPVISTAKPVRPSGPGFIARTLESFQSLNPKHAVSAVAVLGLLGFGYWSFAGNPSRPVAVHPVKGRILMDGQPLANASIVLHRVGHSKLPATLHPHARASADGSFALETFDPADGAPNGDFVATVFLNETSEVNGETQLGPNLLPVVYSKPETSPIKLRITASTRELQPLELTEK